LGKQLNNKNTIFLRQDIIDFQQKVCHSTMMFDWGKMSYTVYYFAAKTTV